MQVGKNKEFVCRLRSRNEGEGWRTGWDGVLYESPLPEKFLVPIQVNEKADITWPNLRRKDGEPWLKR